MEDRYGHRRGEVLLVVERESPEGKSFVLQGNKQLLPEADEGSGWEWVYAFEHYDSQVKERFAREATVVDVANMKAPALCPQRLRLWKTWPNGYPLPPGVFYAE